MNARLASLVTMVLLIVADVHGIAGAQSATPHFPYQVRVEGATVTLYQPQVATWIDYGSLTALTAVAVLADGAKEPVLGSATMTADTVADLGQRTVILYNKQANSIAFPDISPDLLPDLETSARTAIETGNAVIPVDSLLASIQHDFPMPAGNPDISLDAPRIFYSNARAILVVIDGKPMLADIASGPGLQYVVNTNWPLFHTVSDKTWYLLDDRRWLNAPRLTGPWRETTTLPAVFSRLSGVDAWASVNAAIPAESSRESLPRVFVTQKPSELIFIDGKPDFEEIPGTGFEYVENSNSLLLRQEATEDWFYLVVGRWFTAKEPAGPWSPVARLPAGLINIPADSEMAAVLSSVPGTAHARMAAVEARIPQMATVRFTAAPPAAEYAGEPTFMPIDGTGLEFGINTQATIIRDGSDYLYLVNGVWFTGRSPVGPWGVATALPDGLRSISPDSPFYALTFVGIAETGSDSVIVSQTGGYRQTYVVPAPVITSEAGTIAVFGTGHWYDPWSWYDPYFWSGQPVYRAFAQTYGWNATYHPVAGCFMGSGIEYGPGRVGTISGPDTAGCGSNYSTWGNGVVAHDASWASALPVLASGGTIIDAETAANRIYTTGDDDVYAMQNGMAFRRDGKDWEYYDNQSAAWVNWDLSEPNEQRIELAESQGLDIANLSQLDRYDMSGADSQFVEYMQLSRDAAARELGNRRYNEFHDQE